MECDAILMKFDAILMEYCAILPEYHHFNKIDHISVGILNFG